MPFSSYDRSLLPGPSERDTVNSSSFSKNGGRGIVMPVTPTSTIRPFWRQTSAASSTGPLLAVDAAQPTSALAGASAV